MSEIYRRFGTRAETGNQTALANVGTAQRVYRVVKGMLPRHDRIPVVLAIIPSSCVL